MPANPYTNPFADYNWTTSWSTEDTQPPQRAEPPMPVNSPVNPAPQNEQGICSSCHQNISTGNCECFTCASCGVRGDTRICSACGLCEESCCECFVCENCDNRSTSNNDCEDCGRCHTCCTCESASIPIAAVHNWPEQIEPRRKRTIAFFPNPLKFHDATKKEFILNPSKRHLAVELEFIDAKKDNGLSAVVSKWLGSIVKDGSLPPETGFEINCSPANGDVFVKQVVEVCQRLKESEASSNELCGYHIHVDAQDYKYHDIRRLILLYSKIEDALFNIVPTHRRNNKYCPKCAENYLSQVKEGKECKSSICHIVYQISGPKAKEIRQRRVEKYWESRRAALNLHSWMYRGTFECRLAASSANPNKIIPWAMLWGDIIDFAYRKSENDIKKLGASMDGQALLLMIASEAEKNKHKPIVTNFLKERFELFKNKDADKLDTAMVYGDFPY